MSPTGQTRPPLTSTAARNPAPERRASMGNSRDARASSGSRQRMHEANKSAPPKHSAHHRGKIINKSIGLHKNIKYAMRHMSQVKPQKEQTNGGLTLHSFRRHM